MAHSIGKTIASLRKEKGWTQAELAKKLSISDKAVSKWESEIGLPDITIFPDLAKVLGVSIDYLMTGPKEIKAVELKATHQSLSIEEQEAKIKQIIYDGIIDINELIATKDFHLIKKALREYPVHEFEIIYHEIQALYQVLDTPHRSSLFEFAVDRNNHEMALDIINGDISEIKKDLDAIKNSYSRAIQFQNAYPWNYPWTHKRNGKHLTLRGKSKYDIKNFESYMAYLQGCKDLIIEDSSLKIDKEKLIDGLTKEYFENELSNGNEDRVIIKLCVRLEAILKCDYHYDGDLSEMLKKYSSQYGSYYDEDGYSYKEDFVNHLHKLRNQRNSIVHSEKITEKMTADEIKFCIDYICKMG